MFTSTEHLNRYFEELQKSKHATNSVEPSASKTTTTYSSSAPSAKEEKETIQATGSLDWQREKKNLLTQIEQLKNGQSVESSQLKKQIRALQEELEYNQEEFSKTSLENLGLKQQLSK